ncbi:hypothetical protein BJ742DRAFT_742708 [Cladochytrium replicatum]|nr:hypothetical protein BJ742DRAFT_742708 [Cladochytrium replicatum]
MQGPLKGCCIDKRFWLDYQQYHFPKRVVYQQRQQEDSVTPSETIQMHPFLQKLYEYPENQDGRFIQSSIGDSSAYTGILARRAERLDLARRRNEIEGVQNSKGSTSTKQKRVVDDDEDRISSAWAPRPRVVIPPGMLLSNVNLGGRSSVQEPPTIPPPPVGGRTFAQRLVNYTHNMQRRDIAVSARPYRPLLPSSQTSTAEPHAIPPQPAYPASRSLGSFVSHHLNRASVTERGAPMRRSPGLARRPGISNLRARAAQDRLRSFAEEAGSTSSGGNSGGNIERGQSSDQHFRTPLKRRRIEDQEQGEDEKSETHKRGRVVGTPQSPSNRTNVRFYDVACSSGSAPVSSTLSSVSPDRVNVPRRHNNLCTTGGRENGNEVATNRNLESIDEGQGPLEMELAEIQQLDREEGDSSAESSVVNEEEEGGEINEEEEGGEMETSSASESDAQSASIPMQSTWFTEARFFSRTT